MQGVHCTLVEKKPAAAGRPVWGKPGILAGDAAHLVIPTAAGHEHRVGDAIDLSWKLAAILAGWVGLLASYEIERRQVGDRNIAASRYASLGRQCKTNEMIGAEPGYRYVESPVIWDEPGGPEQSFRTYDRGAVRGEGFPLCPAARAL